MKRRQLRSTANSLAHKFAGAAEHMAWMAWHQEVRVVQLDLFEAEFEPESFDIRRNRILARYCRNFLLREIEKLNPPAKIEKAVLEADYAIDNVWFDKESRVPRMGRTVFSVFLTDEKGRVWKGQQVLEPMVISVQSKSSRK